MFNDPVSQFLMCSILLLGAIAVGSHLSTPRKLSKKEILRKKMWNEYNRISRRIGGSPNLAGLVGLNDEILDMLTDYRRVKGIVGYTGSLHAKLLNREGELRKMKCKRIG